MNARRCTATSGASDQRTYRDTLASSTRLALCSITCNLFALTKPLASISAWKQTHAEGVDTWVQLVEAGAQMQRTFKRTNLESIVTDLVRVDKVRCCSQVEPFLLKVLGRSSLVAGMVHGAANKSTTR
jgi:hypothetical protein